METGEIEVLADAYEGRELHRPNDLTIDGQGRIYFTDRLGPNRTPEQTGVHGVYRIDPDGTIERILTEPEVLRPNGIVISPDDTTLYVIEIDRAEGGPRMIRAFDLSPEGTAGNMRVFHDFYPGRSGDGMTIDTQGNLYVAAGLNQPARQQRDARHGGGRPRVLAGRRAAAAHPDPGGHDHERGVRWTGPANAVRHLRKDGLQPAHGYRGDETMTRQHFRHGLHGASHRYAVRTASLRSC